MPAVAAAAAMARMGGERVEVEEVEAVLIVSNGPE